MLQAGASDQVPGHSRSSDEFALRNLSRLDDFQLSSLELGTGVVAPRRALAGVLGRRNGWPVRWCLIAA